MTHDHQADSPTAALRRYLRVLRRQWWIIAFVTIVAVGAAALYAFARTPIYGAQMKIVVGQGDSLFAAEASSAFQPFTQTMTDLLESDIVARRVIQREELGIASSTLLKRMRVTSRPDTSVLDVTYEDTDRARAVRVLGTIGDVFTELVVEQLSRPTRASPTAGAATDYVSATVFDPAHALPGRVAPKVRRTLAVAAVLGLIGGILLAFLRDALSARVRNQDDAVEAFGSTVVGQLPKGVIGVTVAQVDRLPVRVKAAMIESMQLMAATVRFADPNADAGATILVTSARPGDGKSTVVAHLATTLARSGRSVIAVEGDLRKPALHRLLGVPAGLPGLAEVVRDGAQPDDLLVSVDADRTEHDDDYDRMVTYRGGAPNVYFLAAGRDAVRAAPLLSLGGVADLLATLRQLADYVLIDSPPMLLSGDAFPFAQASDTVLVVMREGATSRDEAQGVREMLSGIGVDRLSLVLTESSEALRRSYSYDA